MRNISYLFVNTHNLAKINMQLSMTENGRYTADNILIQVEQLITDFKISEEINSLTESVIVLLLNEKYSVY